MKKKIVVPVDFSPTSLNAYQYALRLSELYDASIELIHVFEGTFSIDKPTRFKAGMSREEAIIDDLKSFAQYTNKEAGDVWTKLDVSTKAIQGLTIPSIIKESKQGDVAMMVMGMTGKGGIINKLIGSVSTEVGQKAHCPVLLIPDKFEYRPLDKILFAANFESADRYVVKQVDDFAKTHDTFVHFVHVDDSSDSEDFIETEDQIFKTIFEEGYPQYPFLMRTIKSSSVLKGLNGYAKNHQMDLIVLANRQRGFFTTLTGQSMTKNMGMATQLPILIFHIN